MDKIFFRYDATWFCKRISLSKKFSPKDMLEMGVFEGKYCNDCVGELPESWFRRALGLLLVFVSVRLILKGMA